MESNVFAAGRSYYQSPPNCEQLNDPSGCGLSSGKRYHSSCNSPWMSDPSEHREDHGQSMQLAAHLWGKNISVVSMHVHAYGWISWSQFHDLVTNLVSSSGANYTQLPSKAGSSDSDEPQEQDTNTKADCLPNRSLNWDELAPPRMWGVG